MSINIASPGGNAAALKAALLAAAGLPPNNRAFSNTLQNASGTTAIPADNTIPQVTEGTKVVEASITPSSNTAKIRVHAQIICSYSVASQFVASALFVNGAANAVAANCYWNVTANGQGEMHLIYEYVPGSTALQTISARAGPVGGAGTLTFNTLSNNVTLGGLILSNITLTEVA
jgi:hypothetical protein